MKMSVNSTHLMPYANNITITTGLASCDNVTWNLNRTLSDLRNLYQNNLTDSVFDDISIVNFNCTNTDDSYFFEQIISFTQAVSIRIQILFVSIYFDYLTANKFQFDGLIIDQESSSQFSSITVNDSQTYDACSTAEIAQDSLCLMNSTCNSLSNPWNFNCSQLLLMTVTPLVNSTSQSEGVVISTGLNSWQIGLISGLGAVFMVFLLFISGFFCLRYRHSKRLTLSHISFYDDVGFMEKTGIPQGQAFQHVSTIIQPIKVRSHTATSWIHDGTNTINTRNGGTYINLKPAGLYNQVSFVDHAKVRDPSLPSDLPMEFQTSATVATSPLNNRIEATRFSRPVLRRSLHQLKLITNEFQENKLFDSSISHNFKTPIPRLSSFDENLTDEDAWMSILDVVNTELAILNGQDRIKTLM